MSKYPIKKEFSPWSHLAPPLHDAGLTALLGSKMKAPGWLRRDREMSVKKQLIKSYDGKDVEILIFEPYGIKEPAPCLVYCHGGAFYFAASGHHYKVARKYALETPCKVVFVQYRLAPKYPHPTPCEDCYAAFNWVFDNADRLSIDKRKIAIGGDSAGGALACAVCHMARDRGTTLPCFQFLVYPVTDRRMQTSSQLQFTDTPMWNSKLSVKMWRYYLPSDDVQNIAYASPMEAESFDGLPCAYVETAEFDCLRDEGKAYADILRNAGIKVELNQTKGTMHGFDLVDKAPTSKEAVSRRIEYLQKEFYNRRN